MSIGINKVLLGLPSRSERADIDTLVETFVNNGIVFDLLSTTNNEIIYGRRGTGKTHLFKYLERNTSKNGDFPVYIDLRTVGSSNSIYSDENTNLSERSTRLMRDIIRHLHDQVISFVLEDERLDLSVLGPCLDSILESVDDVLVTTQVESEEQLANRFGSEFSIKGSFAVGLHPNLKAGVEAKDGTSGEESIKEKRMYTVIQSINYGDLSRRLSNMSSALAGKRLWILLDEWSSVPYDLQPFVADMIRRVFFPISSITIKIAAIEQRKIFKKFINRSNYIGFELGADISSNLNLDDHLVYENNADAAYTFFAELAYNHYKKLQSVDALKFRNAEEFIQSAFTQLPVFDELVRAAEGVPRDAIYIIGKAAQQSLNEKIGVNEIRKAARSHYLSDKHGNITTNEPVARLLRHITDDVISTKKARCFLLNSDVKDQRIDALFDERLIHIVKREISSKSNPGERFTAYKLDYGCYVHFKNTNNEIAEGIENELISGVPVEDYRTIRRVVLDINRFDRTELQPE